MRLPTFSFLKACKVNILVPHVSRRYISEGLETKPTSYTDVANSDFLEVHSTWPETEEPELRAGVLQSMRVLPDFVSEEEEEEFMKELNPYLKKMRYEFDHWDNAIQGYRETERSSWSPAAAAALERVRAAALPGRSLPYAHVLDLAPSGHIKPHVDAVRFCGDVIAGLCLLSPAVMRLTRPDRAPLAIDALLPRRCLYIMSGRARYDMEHAVLCGEASVFRGSPVLKTRRVSVIQRAPPEHPNGTNDRYQRE